MSKNDVFRATRTILQDALTDMGEKNQLPLQPHVLYHYSSLEVLQKILESDDIRLSHAEYSNDQREIEEARSLIFVRLKAATPVKFSSAVQVAFQTQAKDVDAYIFCMTTGVVGSAKPQDVLSQWRAYAQDGRGGALTLDRKGLSALVYHLPGLRLNPVIYDPVVQGLLIDKIIAAGAAHYGAIGAVAIDATVASLVFALPLMKHEGFAEEREWRLIFMPPNDLTLAGLKFQARRDFLAPFLELQYLWKVVRPEMLDLLKDEQSPPVNVPVPSGGPLIPATGLMIGPSGHQQLNVRAMVKAVAHSHRAFTVDTSDTPYRSLT
jgi:hypothetical protein